MLFENFPKMQNEAIKKDISTEIEAKEKEKADIAKIENLNFLGTQDRMNLILTYWGEKPVSEIEMYYDEANPLLEPEEILRAKNNLETALDALGLKFKATQQEQIDEDGFEQKKFQFFVGKNEDNLKELEMAFLEQNNEKIGKLLGYPETAVKAFAQGIQQKNLFEMMLDEKEWWQNLSKTEKESLLQEGVLNFASFKFSKEHWKEELDIIRKWQMQIKEKAPQLYATIMQEKPLLAMTKKERRKWEKEQAEKQLQDIKEEMEKITSPLGKPLEKKIKKAVILLNAFGIRTSASCEGHLQKKQNLAQKQNIIAPYIVVRSKIAQAKNWEENEQLKERIKKQNAFFYAKTKRLLKLFYQDKKTPVKQKLLLKTIDSYGAFRLEGKIKNSSAQKQKEQLQRCQKEMGRFAAFLKKKYPAYLFYHSLED